MLTEEQKSFVDKHYRADYKKLFYYAKSSNLDDSHSEEAVQDTFKIACAKIDDFQSSLKPEAWLMKTLKYVILNMKKCQWHAKKYLLSATITEGFAIKHDLTDVDYEMLFGDIAKSKEFKLFIRVYLDGLTTKEAAREFGLTLETCKKQLQRLKKKIRDNNSTA